MLYMFKVCCEFAEYVTERPPSSTTTSRTTRRTSTTARPKQTTTRPPVTTTRPPVTTTRPPVTTVLPPVITTLPLVITTLPPVTTTLPPVTTTRPTTTTTRPTPTTMRTASTTSLPETTTSRTESTTRRPETTTTTPSPTTQPSTTRLPPIGSILPTDCGRRPASEHIWSNVEDSEHVHTWAVFLEISRRETITGRCVGTMITDRFVLTAAHCLHHLQIDDVTMYFGLLKRSELAECLNDESCQEKKAAQFIIHEEYRVHEKLNDIALILTEDAVQTSDYITPICLPLNHTYDETSANRYSSTVISFGWGRTFNEKLSDTKRVALLRVIPQDECAKTLRFNTTVLSSMMCTLGHQPGQDVCQGDSGAPLVQNYQRLMYVVGVVSYGPRCGMSTDVPGKAMRVSHYLNWILTTIRRYA
uniref:Peptidase S1 domain-containing protein n=1 Tax=Anopheles atroparvus TaxID=41427 RepID=A0AAG5DJ25_ANOAO